MFKYHMNSSSRLSIKAIECFFLWFTGILAVFTICTVFSQVIGLSFSLYVYLSFIVCAMITAIIGVISKKYIENATSNDLRVLISISVIGIITAGITLFTHRPDADDYYYVPNAIYHLEHPQESLDFGIHSLALEHPDQKIISYTWGTSLAFEYMQAAFAYILNYDYLFFYHIMTPALMGFLIPIGLFYMFSYFAQKSENAVIASLITTAIILLLGETHRTFGNCFLTRVFQGKIVCLTIGLYIFISFTLRYFKHLNLFYWLCIFTTITGMIGITTSTIILFPPLSIVLLLALVLSKQVKFSSGLSYSYFATFMYLGGYALFLVKYSPTNLGTDSPVNYGWPTTFWGHAQFFYNPQKPITVIVVIISTVLGLSLMKHTEKLFFSAWIVLVCCLYLNPIVAPFLIRNVTTPNIYWRMFYLYPFPLLLGISIMKLFDRLTIKWRLRGSILTLIVFGVFHILPFSSSAFHSGLQFGWPGYKLPDKPYQIAKEVIRFAPQGTMLAPPHICGIIPLLSSAYPQIRLREDGERLWFGNEQAELRIQASDFVETGEQALFQSFKKLLEHPTLRVQSIVMHREVFNKIEVKNVLTNYGFDSYQYTNDHVVLW